MMDMPSVAMSSTSWFDILSLVLNFLLGGGLLLTLLTIRSFKLQKRGEAEQAAQQAEVIKQQANSSEIDNMDKIAKMWREQAETLDEKLKANEERMSKIVQDNKEEMTQMSKCIEDLKKEVTKMVNINTKIVKSLEKINAENYEKIVEQIKADIHSAS